MVVVMEVISFLEKYPITKEALEVGHLLSRCMCTPNTMPLFNTHLFSLKETRLGKLINDVRKKTKNEDLARRAKKLLRNWQKLIEPEKVEVSSKGHTGALWSSNVGALACISASATAIPSGKTGPELKNRNDFNNCSAPRVEKISNRKHKGEQKEGQLLPAKIPTTALNDKIPNLQQLAPNRIGGSLEVFTETCAYQPSEREFTEKVDNDRLIKIPVNAVKPGHSKPPSACSLLKASFPQEQAASGGQHRPRNPHGSLHNSQTSKEQAGGKKTARQAQCLHSLTKRPVSVGTFGLGPSTQPFSAELDSKSIPPKTSFHNLHGPSCSDGVSLEDGAVSNSGKGTGQKCKPKDCVVKSDGQTVEDSAKPVRLKDRRLTFDPVTGQIKPSLHKESYHEGLVRLGYKSESQGSEQAKQSSPVIPSPLQQTDWKELSRSEIIKSYLSQQSSVLISSGAHASGAHFFMTEVLKNEEHITKDAKKTHTFAPEIPVRDLPGISREIVTEDLKRLHTQHWPGVNGCYDTKGNWFDWTECISLDPHGDESRLNILPYVCLD